MTATVEGAIIAAFLAFCRIGACFLVMPGLSSARVPMQVRLFVAIAATGGLVGLCFAGIFIDPDPAKVTFERLMDHLDHLIEVAGTDHVGLGSDFDGYTAPPGIAVRSCLDLPRITSHLQERGHSEAEIAAVMGGNWLRVFRSCFG